MAWQVRLKLFNVSIRVTSTSFLKIEITGSNNFVEKKMEKDGSYS